MKKKNKLGKYEKGVIITGVIVAIIFLILLTADGIKNMPIGLSEQQEQITNTPNAPTLSAGMIPVKMMGDNLIICKNDSLWYNYGEGNPAYIMLNDGVYQSEPTVDMTGKKLASENIGQVVSKEEQGSIYMWIPRYAINTETEEIKYIKDIQNTEEGFKISETFTYKTYEPTSPDFLLTGIWVEKYPLANVNSTTTKVTNMNQEESMYGFISNTKAEAITTDDITTITTIAGAYAFNIDKPSSINRTTLRIINDKNKDPIKAKATYTKTTALIEIQVTYSEYEINKIVLKNEKEEYDLNFTNTNGIITANTSEIELLVDGTYTITITDNQGNIKELEIQVVLPLYYGREVTNYTCNSSGVSKWRLFYADDNNIYLIADDYVSYSYLPTSTKGTRLNKGNTNYKAYFTAILNDYTGSAWIRSNTNANARKWLNRYLTSYPSSTNENMKAVAYMMDTKKWSNFAGEKSEYAIGGPTIELFCASYRVTHPNKYVVYSTSSYGYFLKWSNTGNATSVAAYLGGFTRDDFESIYIKSDSTKASGMWITSPAGNSEINIMYSSTSGLNNYSSGYSSLGFRPVVCLKSGVKLVNNEDGTYSIQ